MNMETMRAMKEGAVHLKRIHGNLCVGSPTSLLRTNFGGAATSTRSTRRWRTSGSRWTCRRRSRTPSPTRSAWATTYVSFRCSCSLLNTSAQLDEDELKAELDELEQEQLDERLAGAHSVPVTSPGRVDPGAHSCSAVHCIEWLPVRTPAVKSREEADEEEELRQLQAELAMYASFLHLLPTANNSAR
jgi:charged multivesicular body protein 4